MSSRNLLDELDYSFTIDFSSVSAPVLVCVLALSPQMAYRYCPSLLVGRLFGSLVTGLAREIIEVAKIGPVQFERAMEKLQDRFTYEVKMPQNLLTYTF